MLSTFFVKKIEWERGEEYGDAYYPSDFSSLQKKIQELDLWGRSRNHPFLVIFDFDNPTIYLAFTVGHDFSYMEFAYDMDSENKTWKGPFYLDNKNGNSEEIIPIYYMGSYSELDTTKMLPYDQVLLAIYSFIEHKMFPSSIKLDQHEANRRFVTS